MHGAVKHPVDCVISNEIKLFDIINKALLYIIITNEGKFPQEYCENFLFCVTMREIFAGDERMERLRRLRYVLLHELRARIMTLILVVFLPISIALITLSTTVLVRFSEQSRDRALHELSMQMTQMERDAVGVEHYADEFVRNYLMQINAPSGFSNAMLPYDMIEDLGRWYSYLDLPGFLYLYDNTGERCYTKYYGGTQDVSEKERLTKEVEGFAAVVGPMHFTLRDVGGRDYLCRTYEYRSCRIGFLIDAPECIYNALAGSWD